jgi:hypothetical protein
VGWGNPGVAWSRSGEHLARAGPGTVPLTGYVPRLFLPFFANTVDILSADADNG